MENNSGKSKSLDFPNGKRRQTPKGSKAPRSLRHIRKLVSTCTDKQLEKAKVIREVGEKRIKKELK